MHLNYPELVHKNHDAHKDVLRAIQYNLTTLNSSLGVSSQLIDI